LLFRRCRQPGPGPTPFDRVEEEFQPALDIAGGDLFGRGRNPRTERGGTGLVVRIECGIEFAAGLGQDELAQKIRPLLRCPKRDMAAAGMPHQVHRSGLQLLDEGNDIGDVLRDRIAVAASVPLLGKEVPQGHRDDPMLPGQWPEHA
jgi:hypothetical protein